MAKDINDFDFLNNDDRKLLKKYASIISKRHLEVPFIFILETLKPLNFIGSQIMLGFEPLIGMLFNTKDFKHLQRLLENRNTIEYFIQLLEKLAKNRD